MGSKINIVGWEESVILQWIPIGTFRRLCADYVSWRMEWGCFLLCTIFFSGGQPEFLPVARADESFWEFYRAKRQRNMSADEILQYLFHRAMGNTAKVMPARLFAGGRLEEKDFLKDGIFLREEIVESVRNWKNSQIFYKNGASEQFGLRLTNTFWMGGAVAAFYRGIGKELAELLEEEFYLLVLNPNEARVHPVSEDKRSDIERAARIAKCRSPLLRYSRVKDCYFVV